jgi:hypothetical protein
LFSSSYLLYASYLFSSSILSYSILRLNSSSLRFLSLSSYYYFQTVTISVIPSSFSCCTSILHICLKMF